MKKDEISISIVSALFLVYVVFISFGIFPAIAFLIFMISPVLIIGMVYSVLKHGKFEGEEFKENQEFGYLDKPQLGRNENDH